MTHEGLVIGIPEGTEQDLGQTVAEKLRDFTITWSRYTYQGPILRGTSIEEVLDSAIEAGFRQCLVQAPGVVIRERWASDETGEVNPGPDRAQPFLVAGLVSFRSEFDYSLSPRCMLVDLGKYQELGRPRFTDPPGTGEVPGVVAEKDGEKLSCLRPSPRSGVGIKGNPGSGFLRASLDAGLSVPMLEEWAGRRALDLGDPDRVSALIPYLGEGIERFEPGKDAELSAEQDEFLAINRMQTRQARRAVFLFNIENYDDVEAPARGFRGPVQTLYSVAAGFKPNRILETHEFDASTRVVYFDYSQKALDIRQCMVERWDGSDFPSFIRSLFEDFPYPSTHYYFWNDATPETLEAGALERAWERELERWGGAARFQEHWQRYRSLAHQYVHCDIVSNPDPLLGSMSSEVGSVIWWSNAFFTMYGNWNLSMEERRHSFERWSEKLAAANPALSLFGSDHNNTCVNDTEAGAFVFQYRKKSGGNPMDPSPVQRTQIRM